jgi:hypothetical protein
VRCPRFGWTGRDDSLPCRIPHLRALPAPGSWAPRLLPANRGHVAGTVARTGPFATVPRRAKFATRQSVTVRDQRGFAYLLCLQTSSPSAACSPLRPNVIHVSPTRQRTREALLGRRCGAPVGWSSGKVTRARRRAPGMWEQLPVGHSRDPGKQCAAWVCGWWDGRGWWVRGGLGAVGGFRPGGTACGVANGYGLAGHREVAPAATGGPCRAEPQGGVRASPGTAGEAQQPRRSRRRPTPRRRVHRRAGRRPGDGDSDQAAPRVGWHNTGRGCVMASHREVAPAATDRPRREEPQGGAGRTGRGTVTSASAARPVGWHNTGRGCVMASHHGVARAATGRQRREEPRGVGRVGPGVGRVLRPPQVAVRARIAVTGRLAAVRAWVQAAAVAPVVMTSSSRITGVPGGGEPAGTWCR